MKNLVLVIGRSGSGKDTIVRAAQKHFGIPAIPSYTDRPKRECETEGVEHTFLTSEQFDDILTSENVFAYTKIGETGYRYCTTVKMLNALDGDTIFYIIDPKGYYYCKPLANEFNVKVAYIYADVDKRMERANTRNGDDSAWVKRCEDEDEQFTEFEKQQPWDILVENNGDAQVAIDEFIEKFNEVIGK